MKGLGLIGMLERSFRELPHLPRGAHGEADADSDRGRDGEAAAGNGEVAAGNGEAPRLRQALWDRALLDPAREFLRRPGKGLRGRLVEIAWNLAGGAAGGPPEELCALVELLHAGSLVLDDIQDGSEERRGAPALHRICGVPVALNTGNWMVFWPLQLVDRLGLPPEAAAEAYRRLAGALVSCHQGQALDLSLPPHELDRAEVPEVVAMSTRLRTAALTELAATLGGLAAGAPPPAMERLAALGCALGLGLQMLDDLGGLVAEDRRGKGEEDLRLARPTWAWAWAAEVEDEAGFAALQAQGRQVAGGADPGPLRAQLAARVAALGRRRAREALRSAGAVAIESFAGGPAVEQVTAEIELLERSYG